MSSSSTLTTHETFQNRMLQAVSRSFAFTIPQLPALLIRPVGNAYLMCRIVDTIEDDAQLPLDQKQHFFQVFNQVLNGEVPAQQFAEGLTPLLSDSIPPAEHDLIRETPTVVDIFSTLSDNQQVIIRQCVSTMSHGMLEFQKIQNPQGLETLTQLNDYCYYVAGVVGEMLTGLFCDYSAEIAQHQTDMMQLATSFGQGLQMTNIIKDVWDDHERGVCWFPQNLFQEEGFDLATLRPGNNDPAFDRGLQSLIGITHGHLQNALSYTLMLPKHETGIRKFCLWAVGMALATLKKIHDTRNYSGAREVTISRATTRRIVLATNTAIRSNLLLKQLFQIAARGIPSPTTKVMAVPPHPAQAFTANQ